MIQRTQVNIKLLYNIDNISQNFISSNVETQIVSLLFYSVDKELTKTFPRPRKGDIDPTFDMKVSSHLVRGVGGT